MNLTTKAAGLLAGIALVATNTASAQELTLRAADSLPVGHYMSESLIKPFMAEVEERSGGKITFEYFPAQQLGKAVDMLSLTQSGVADIGYVGPAYTPDKMPLSSVAELPEEFTSACEGTTALWELSKEGGALDVAEFAPNGVRVLMLLVLPPFRNFVSKEIEDLSSLEGLKISIAGSLRQKTVSNMGVVPLQMPAPELREALTRGTIDGVSLPNASILVYDLASAIKSTTDAKGSGSGLITFMISVDKFNSLSPEVQEMLTEVGREVTFSGCKEVDVLDVEARQKLEELGIKFVRFNAEDEAKVQNIFASVGDEWATEMDAQGLPASDILKQFRDILGR